MKLPNQSSGALRLGSRAPHAQGALPSRILVGGPASPPPESPWLLLWIVANCYIFRNMFCCPCKGGPSRLCCYPTDGGW
jgi:hypothetical protein